MCIGLYYSNTWSTKDFPFLSTKIFNTDRTKCNQTAVFGSGTLTLDHHALMANGVPRLAASYAWTILASCLAVSLGYPFHDLRMYLTIFLYSEKQIGALITHTILFWGKDIVKDVKSPWNKTQPDVHYVAMGKYGEVPQVSCVAITPPIGLAL